MDAIKQSLTLNYKNAKQAAPIAIHGQKEEKYGSQKTQLMQILLQQCSSWTSPWINTRLERSHSKETCREGCEHVGAPARV